MCNVLYDVKLILLFLVNIFGVNSYFDYSCELVFVVAIWLLLCSNPFCGYLVIYKDSNPWGPVVAAGCGF